MLRRVTPWHGMKMKPNLARHVEREDDGEEKYERTEWLQPKKKRRRRRRRSRRRMDNDLRCVSNGGNICSAGEAGARADRVSRRVLLHGADLLPIVACRETCPTSACIGIHYPRRSAPGSLLFPRDLFWSTGGTSAAAARRWTAAGLVRSTRQVLTFRGSPSPANYACLFLPPPLSPPPPPPRSSASLLGPLLSSAAMSSCVSIAPYLIFSARCLFAGFSLARSSLSLSLPTLPFFRPPLFSPPSRHPLSASFDLSSSHCRSRANFLHSSRSVLARSTFPSQLLREAGSVVPAPAM